MREIKFRAWDTHFKEMIYPNHDSWSDVFWCNNEKVHAGYPNEELGGDWIEMPIMQYTGLKDRNGKEIYEGDIVRSGGSTSGIVEFYRGAFNAHYFGESGDIQEEWEDPLHMHILEVIGNIYENPELLQGDDCEKN